MNSQIEVDLGLAKVSDGALAMLERVGRIPGLPQGVFCGLLDALTEEHMRRFGARMSVPPMFKLPMRTVDPDDLWHSLRVLGNWLSYEDEASRRDPDMEAASEVIARMWLAMRGALTPTTDGEAYYEANN